MSSGQPFDEFGRLLANGLEIPLSFALSHGFPEGRIAALFLRYASGADSTTVGRLRNFANDMSAAGDSLNGMPPQSTIDIEGIPVNPFLQESRGGGTRLFVSTDFSTDQGESWYRVDIDLPDAATIQEIYDAVREEAGRRSSASPGAFGGKAVGDDTEIQIRITIAERAF